jgi:translation initiation factor 2 beta subunit (eIF-2beta)/eIF-5
LTANKSNLLTQIEDALARDNANVCVNLMNIAQIFAQVDQRLATMEGKLERLLAERPPLASARAEQLLALVDERIKAALDRDVRLRGQATADVVRDVLKDFVDEFKQVRGEIETKLIRLRALLAERAPVDPRPN